MIFAHYEEQRSFDEYIDMTFKELHYRANYEAGEGLPLWDQREVFDFVIDGYWPDFGDMPRWVEIMLDCNKPRIQRRRLKKWCKKLFDQYGENEKVKILYAEFESELEEFEAKLLENELQNEN